MTKKNKKTLFLMALLAMLSLSSCKGETGERGATWLTGIKEPTSSIGGKVGDFYYDIDDCDIYQLTESGWVLISNIKGATGEKGETGSTGEKGDTPNITIGSNGNWYIDGVDTGVKAQGETGATGEKGETGSTGEKGEKGEQGVSGENGATWLTGETAPNNEDGEEGDLYLNITTWDIYKKVNGKWSIIGNIKGIQGEIGATGEKGEIGATGATGEKGEKGEQGVPGEKGATWLTGDTTPNNEDGEEGDLYLNITTWDIYLKQEEKWKYLGNIEGDDAIHANETCTVTYDAQGGVLASGVETSISVNYGDTLELPIPTKTNYIFEGWYTGNTVNDGKFTTVTPVTKNITLYARWKSNVTYQIFFETNGGNGISPQTYSFDEEINSLPNPVKFDSTFIGWYIDKELTQRVAFPITLTDSIEVYAKWTTAYYSINFHTNCNEAISSRYLKAGTIVNDLSSPSKKNKEFGGWYYDSGFNNKVPESFEIHSDLDLYAKWNDIEYTISYSTNGGSSIANEVYTAGYYINSLPTPKKSNYNFKGWYLDGSYNTPVTLPYVVEDNTVFYAKWEFIDPYSNYNKIYTISDF